jgi:tRNA1Val (adenine37-N6)-methyltransferase
MANSWFRFKQFTVHQQYSAMKVTTDACLFGALFSQFQPAEGIRMLDIGTGTGLLSLMAAQKNPGAHITAVEINRVAAEEAAKNFAQSPFAANIHLEVTNILDYYPSMPFQYIFSNPPFYEHQLKSSDAGKNMAHHDTALTMEALLIWIKKWLHPFGTASLLIPYYREEELLNRISQMEMEVPVVHRVKQTPSHAYFRSIILIEKRKQTHKRIEVELTIKDNQNEYSEAFVHLLSPFYLKL